MPDEYKPVVEQTKGRDLPPSLTELHEKLINYEAKVLISTPATITPISAKYVNNTRPAQKQTKRPHQNWNNASNNSFHQNWTHAPNNNQQRTFRTYLGRCQICGVQGHSARRCTQLQQYQQSTQPPLLPTPQYPQSAWNPRANMALTSAQQLWVLDSSATHHITSDLNNLSLHQPYTGGVVLIGDGRGLPISHTGSVSLPTNLKPLSLTNVFLVPHIHKNLLSVYKLRNHNRVSVEFFPSHFQVKDLTSGARLLQGRTNEGTIRVANRSISTSCFFFAVSTVKTSLSNWHSRLGHPSISILITIISKFSLPVSESVSKNFSCVDCLSNKSHKLSFAQTSISSTRPLQYLYTDLWTPPVISFEKFKHYRIIVDHYTRYSWFYPLQLKSHVKETFIKFKALTDNKFQTKISTLFSEWRRISLRSFLSEKGISHLTALLHTPEHNGLSKRRHFHIVETGLSLLHQAKLPNTFWTYAFASAVYPSSFS